jgi:peroxiredoxin Q/BCP
MFEGGFMRIAHGLLAGALVAAGLMAAAPAASAGELKPGDPAPAFSLPGTDGKTHSLDAMKGQWVVLAWFPKAFTAG